MARWRAKRPRRRLREEYQAMGRKGGLASKAKAPPGYYAELQRLGNAKKKALREAAGKVPATYFSPRLTLYREQWKKLLWIKENEGLHYSAAARQAMAAWLAEYEAKRGAPIPVEEPGPAESGATSPQT